MFNKPYHATGNNVELYGRYVTTQYIGGSVSIINTKFGTISSEYDELLTENGTVGSDRVHPTQMAFSHRIESPIVAKGNGTFYGPTSVTRSSEVQLINKDALVYRTVPDPVALAMCTSRFLAKLRDSSLDLVTSAAEAKQSASMIAKSGRSVARWQDGVKSFVSTVGRAFGRKTRYAEAASKAISNLWLEYTYGWVPLMSDIWGTAEFHRTLLRQREVRAVASHYSDINRVYASNLGTTVRAQGRASDRVLMYRRYTINNPDLYDATRLGSLNPAAVVWELLPYSFVFDWFVDVGGYLEDLQTSCALGLSLDSTSGYDTYSSASTERHYVIRNTREITLWGDGMRKVNIKRRIKRSTTPSPQLPTLSVELGGHRLINAAALARQLVPRGIERVLRF